MLRCVYKLSHIWMEAHACMKAITLNPTSCQYKLVDMNRCQANNLLQYDEVFDRTADKKPLTEYNVMRK